MATIVFPDNTVLCNFAAVHRVDLLRGWLRERGRWTEAVEYEARKSSEYLPDLDLVLDEGWLGEPIEINDESALSQVEAIRKSVFGGLPEKPRQHLGEAETCFLIKQRPEFAESWWLTDDEDAYEYAVRRQIETLRTIDVMRNIVADGDLTPDSAFALMNAMADRDRGLFVPPSARDLM